MSVIPFTLPPNSKILIAGAGGGFDFLCGLPIVLELQERGHELHIANYSFTHLQNVQNAAWHSGSLLEVTADSYLSSGDYFPEKHLSLWYRMRRGVEKPVWCLARQGVRPTLDSYNYLITQLGIDVVMCIDGGVDGIFRGDEHDLGTPSMDSISIIATSLCKASLKIYSCTAFGTEGAESRVSHAQALNRMSDLTQQGAMLGVGLILKNSSAGGGFVDAANFIFDRLPPLHRSTIVSTILAAMEGHYGRTTVNEKTRERQPWISPLTALVWYFDANMVAQMKLFYEQAKESSTVEEVASAIEVVRQQINIKPFEAIPL